MLEKYLKHESFNFMFTFTKYLSHYYNICKIWTPGNIALRRKCRRREDAITPREIPPPVFSRCVCEKRKSLGTVAASLVLKIVTDDKEKSSCENCCIVIVPWRKTDTHLRRSAPSALFLDSDDHPWKKKHTKWLMENNDGQAELLLKCFYISLYVFSQSLFKTIDKL